MTTTIEEVRAVFGNTIQPGLDLVKAESICVDYETTLVNSGQVQTRMRITEMVCKETAIEFRVNGVPRTLPTELAPLDKISLLVVSPPTSLRRVTVKLRGAIRKAASVRAVGIVAWSLPFQGGWSPQGIPDVSMPPGWNEFFPHGAHDD